MLRAEKSIIIGTLSDNIWELLVADRLLEWQPYMKKMNKQKYITEINSLNEKYKVGTIILFGKTCHYEIIESIKNKKIKYRAYENTFLGEQGAEVTFTIDSMGDKCKLTYAVTSNFSSKLSKILVGNYFVKKWLEKRIMIELEMLKNILESKI